MKHTVPNPTRPGALKPVHLITDRAKRYRANATPPIFREAVLPILATIAKQERIRISEEGKAIGRPRCVVDVECLREMRAAGLSTAAIAAAAGASPATVARRLRTAT